MKNLRYLLGYGYWREGIKERYENLITRHQNRGYDIEGFCVTLDPPGPRLSYPDLDRRWRRRDKKLLRMYRKLEEKLKDFDVFILHNGANIHPGFLEHLSSFNVYMCFDDPESSEDLSKPVAKYFDLALTGNVGCVNLYKSWGVKNVDFFPLGFYEDDYNPNMTEKDIFDKNREIDCILLCERQSKYREKPLNKLTKALPNLFGRGKGWPEGFLPQNQVIISYQNSKIGINIHNSVGPVNLRTYMLPANGVMQICDNKHMLGYLFKLGKEVVGYDTIEEGIELVEYYLAHENERKQIALNGWKRVLKDYSETAVWELLIGKIAQNHMKGIKNKKLFYTRTDSQKKSAKSTFPMRIRTKVYYLMNRFFNHYGYELQKKGRIEEDFVFDFDDKIIPYFENPEAGPINLDEKEKRLKNGGHFEWQNMIALNQTVVSLLGNSKTILEIGSGTGCFAWHAAMDNSRNIVASEMDIKAKEWAIKNRSSENIQYFSKLLKEFKPNSFDIAVAVDVIEHIKDYSTFLKELSCVAQKAVITTPNKLRNEKSARISPPEYYQHVREWTAGEFYWILKVFYRDVRLYSMPNPYIPIYSPINALSRKSPLIAVCNEPYQKTF